LANTIKINRGLVTILAKDNQWLKAISVFYSLKFLYSGGIILDITKRYSFFANKLGISESNLRSKVKFLIKNGLIEKKNNNLYFSSFNKIKEKFKIKTQKGYKLAYKNPKELEVILKTLVLEENLHTQEFKLKEKILSEELKKFGKIEAKSTRKKIKRYLRKYLSHLTEKYKKRELQNSNDNLLRNKRINTDLTLSRNKIANSFGRKSKSTGSRFINKAKSLDLVLEDKKRVEKVRSNVSYKIIRYMELDSSYFIFKNNLYKRMSNELTFINFIA